MNPELLQTITQKLENELNEIKNNFVPINPIKDYLLKACQDNDYLTDMLLTPNHTLISCAKYVEQEVRKALNNQNGYLDDAEVYGMAEDFYYLNGDDVTLLASPVKSESVKPTVTPISQSNKPQKQDTQLSLFDTLDPSPQEKPNDNQLIEMNDNELNEEAFNDEQKIA